MFLRRSYATGTRFMSQFMAQSTTPMEDALRQKVRIWPSLGLKDATTSGWAGYSRFPRLYISRLTGEQIGDALKPTTFEIYNDSHKHAHHKAMQGQTSREVCSRSHYTDVTHD